MRWMIAVLAIAGLAMQARLWFSVDGFRKTQELRAAVQEQQAQNGALKRRNSSLEAEVVNLKQRSEAAEERARSTLGMIGKNETFYQVVPTRGDSG